MTRLLIIAGVLLALGLLLERWHGERERTARELASTLRPLSAVTAERVSAIDVEDIGTAHSWHYVRADSAWRYPDYHDAYADTAGIGQLLRALCGSLATVVATDGTQHARYGITGPDPIRVRLAGGGAVLLDALIGRGAPGPRSSEAYVKLAAADTVYHLHANPRHALARKPGTGLAPMLDFHVLPRALGHPAIVALRAVDPQETARPLRLRRIELEPVPPTAPGQPPEGPGFAWLAAIGKDEVACNPDRANDYVSFVRDLRYDALVDATPAGTALPATHPASAVAGDGRRVEIEHEDGAIDVLEVLDGATAGEDLTGSRVLLHNHTTGQTGLVRSEDVALLFPSVADLLDSNGPPPASRQPTP